MVPNGDYEQEAKVLRALERLDCVDSCMGLANIEAMDGYMPLRWNTQFQHKTAVILPQQLILGNADL